MKRLLIAACVVGGVLLLVGPVREWIGQALTASRKEAQRPTARALPTAGVHTTADDVQEAILEYRMRSAKRVKQVQRALKQAGFDPGSIDGLIGHRTHTALLEFQKAHHLEPDGVLGVKTWEALRAYLPAAKATEVDTQ